MFRDFQHGLQTMLSSEMKRRSLMLGAVVVGLKKFNLVNTQVVKRIEVL